MSGTPPNNALSPSGRGGAAGDWRLLNGAGVPAGQSVDPVDGEELHRHAPQLTHCALCRESVKNTPYDRWYVPLDKSCCICEECFQHFRERFGWRLLDGWDIQWPDT